MNTELENKLKASTNEREMLIIAIDEFARETGVSKMKAMTVLQGAAARLGTSRGERTLELLCELKGEYMEEIGLCLASDSAEFIAQVEQNAGI